MKFSRGDVELKKILIVDDDRELCILIEKCIEQEGYSGIIANTAKDALKTLENKNSIISLIILDVMLPDLSGFQVLRTIREHSNIPVLMLTAKGSEEDKVLGLRMGADDYLSKPFGINELMARVSSLIRRYTVLNSSVETTLDRLILHEMKIDNANRTVFVKDKPVSLTSKEFDLLSFLATNKGRVFTKKQIYTQVWGDEYAFDDSNIMSFISKLRKKIEPDPEQPFYIQTVRGVGYRLNKEA